MTNNSYLPESHEVRHCVEKYKNLGEYVLQVAKVIKMDLNIVTTVHINAFLIFLPFFFGLLLQLW